MKKAFLQFLLFLMLAPIASAAPWGPWSSSEDAPVIRTANDRTYAVKDFADLPVPSIAETPFIWLLRIYQQHITKVDGDRCSMHPTCSQYSVQAIHRHGPLIGIVMTSDRLIHEYDEQGRSPLIKVGNRWRYDDSVSNNDFWWSDK